MAWAWIENGHIFVAYSEDAIPKNVQVVEVPDTTTPSDLVIDGDVLGFKTAEEKLNEKKTEKISQLTASCKKYIEQFYPDVKQRSDVADKEYWGSWLLKNGTGYTADSIYKQVYQSAQKILDGLSDLATEVSQFPVSEQIAWEQLIKIALRVGFVQRVKQEYYTYKRQIENATTEAELPAKFVFTTPYPQGA